MTVLVTQQSIKAMGRDLHRASNSLAAAPSAKPACSSEKTLSPMAGFITSTDCRLHPVLDGDHVGNLRSSDTSDISLLHKRQLSTLSASSAYALRAAVAYNSRTHSERNALDSLTPLFDVLGEVSL